MSESAPSEESARTALVMGWSRWTILTLAVGVACLAVIPPAVYHEARRNEHALLEYRFSEAAQAELRNVAMLVNRTLHTIEGLRIPVHLEGEGLTQANFDESCALLSRPSSIALLMWNALVLEGDRDAYEMRMRAMHADDPSFASFEIFEIRMPNLTHMDPSVRLNTSRADKRDMYLPVTYMYAASGIHFGSRRIGVDLLSSPPHKRAGNLTAALFEGEPAIFTNMNFAGDRLGKGTFFFVPAYRGAKVPATVEERKRMAVGFVSAVAGMTDMIDEARAHKRSLHMYVFEANGRGLLYADEGMPLVDAADDIPAAHGVRLSLTLAIANKKLSFLAVPSDELARLSTTSGPVIYAAAASLAIAVLIVAALTAGDRITRSQRSMEESEERRQIVSKMIGYVNHEVRNPLNGMLGCLDVMSSAVTRLQKTTKAERSIVKELGKAIEDARAQGELMTRVVDDMLDIRSLDEGRMHIVLAPASVSSILSKLVTAVRLRLAEKPALSLRVDDLEGSAAIMCDADRVLQVLLNLVVNSIKYSEAGEVHVRTEVVAGQQDKAQFLRFSVTDSGKGIEHDKRHLIFQPWRQLNGMSRGQGVGLGLYLCSMLAKRMGGSMGFSSAVGVGSTFWIDIPHIVSEMPVEDVSIRTPELSSRSTTPESRPHSDSGDDGDVRDANDSSEISSTRSDHTIPALVGASSTPPLSRRHLVCDDDKINRTVLKHHIRRVDPHSTIDEACDGPAACELAAANDYDFVWLDMRMPNMSGVDVAKQIQADGSRNRGVLIVGITGDVTADDLRDYRDAGMRHLLSKPVKAETIAQMIEQPLR